MYKIGNTSGLEEKNCDEGKQSVKVVGEIVDKMAKKCADVPKKMSAPNKIMEITDGCFSSAQVTEVTDEKSSGSSDSDSESCSKAASTSGSCGGGKSSKTTNKDSKSCCGKKSCCGGKSTSSTNSCTGSKLVDTYVPSTIDDMVAAGDYLDSLTDEQIEFMNEYCAQHPFPECATCPYANKFRGSSSRDLSSIFSQMRDAINALTYGNYETATGMFVCPGLSKSLLTADLGPLAEIAAMNAVSSLLDIMSVRGALEAFADLATAAIYTDFRLEVMRAVDTLFKAGSCVGIPKKFVKEVNNILTLVGCTANQFTRMTTRSGSSRSSRFGCGCNTWGKKGSSTKQVKTKVKSQANTNKKSRVTGKSDSYIDPTGKVVSNPEPEALEETNVDDAIPTVYKSATRQEPTTESVEKSEKAKKETTKALKAAKEVTENPAKAQSSGQLKPTKSTNTYEKTTDTVAKAGKTYCKKDKNGKYIKIDTTAEEPLDLIEAKYGPIFAVEDNGLTDTTEPTTVAVTTTATAQTGKIYKYKDPATNEYVEIVSADKNVGTIPTGQVTIKTGDNIKAVREKIAKKLNAKEEDIEIACQDDPKPTYLTYKKPAEQKAIKDKVYYKKTVDTETGKVTYTKKTYKEGEQLEDDTVALEEETGVSYQTTPLLVPVSGVTYYVVDENGIFTVLDTSSGAFPMGVTIYERVIVPEGNTYATPFDCSGPCVLNNGLMIEEPVFLDMESQDMGVDTTSLDTSGRVPAGEMVEMLGLGLTLYEVKMAYVLDHERNGSILPVDVEYKPVSTILDTIADND